MLLSDSVSDAVVEATQSQSPVRVMTYLANGVEVSKRLQNESTQENVSIQEPRKSVPYSIISATDSKILLDMLNKSSGLEGNSLVESKLQGNDWQSSILGLLISWGQKLETRFELIIFCRNSGR